MRKTCWPDKWVRNEPLRYMFLDIFRLLLQDNATTSDVWSQREWDLTFRKALHDWELGIVADFYQALEGLKAPKDNEDTMIREGTNKKVLPVREAYAYYSNIGQQYINWPWNPIWKLKIPCKVNCFTWLVARRTCLTHENLQRVGMQLKLDVSMQSWIWKQQPSFPFTVSSLPNYGICLWPW